MILPIVAIRRQTFWPHRLLRNLEWPCRCPFYPTLRARPGPLGLWHGRGEGRTSQAPATSMIAAATTPWPTCEQSEQTSKAIAGDFARLLAERWRRGRDLCSFARKGRRPRRQGRRLLPRVEIFSGNIDSEQPLMSDFECQATRCLIVVDSSWVIEWRALRRIDKRPFEHLISESASRSVLL